MKTVGIWADILLLCINKDSTVAVYNVYAMIKKSPPILLNSISQSLSKHLQFYKGELKDSPQAQQPKETAGTTSSKEAIGRIVWERKQFLNPMMALSYQQNPIKPHTSKGQYFYELDGQRILDCINNVSHIGHCHPLYSQRMQSQLGRLLTNSRFIYDELMEATHKLLKRFPPELCVVTYVNSGSEANDIALQMAEIHSKRRGIICLDGAYHGITKSCMEISPYKWNEQHQPAPHVQIAKSPCTYRGFLRNSSNPESDYANYIESIIQEDTGAFISEFMQSCAGQIIPPRGLYKKVYEKLKSRGVVTIGDEVQTGFGRLGECFWAYEYYGVTPDIVTIGKAMGNGFPVSAIVCTKEVAKSYEQKGMELFSTFGGNPLAATAVSCVLQVIQNEKLQQNALKTGQYLHQKLQGLRRFEFVGDIRGVGLFQGIDIVKDRESRVEDGQKAFRIITLMRERHILVSRDGMKGNVLKIKPPIVFDKSNVDDLVTAFNEVMEMVERQ